MLFPTLYSTKRTGVTSNPFRLRLHSWKGNVSTWTNSPWYSFSWVRFQIPHPTDFEWKSWKTSWSWLSGCFYMLLSAVGFLFWAPAMMSENLSHAANFRSTNLKKKQHRNRPLKYEIKTSTYQNISKYYMTTKYYKVLVFLLYSHTWLTCPEALPILRQAAELLWANKAGMQHGSRYVATSNTKNTLKYHALLPSICDFLPEKLIIKIWKILLTSFRPLQDFGRPSLAIFRGKWEFHTFTANVS